MEFLYEEQIESALSDLIIESKDKLVIVSPYIKLNERIKDKLKSKFTKNNCQITILFGKSVKKQGDYFDSLNEDSFNFLKSLPNVEIYYNQRMHAKFYANDFEYILTSMNLYDYSIHTNFEIGFRGVYNLEKAEGFSEKLNSYLDKIRFKLADTISGDDDYDEELLIPIQKIESFIGTSDLVYKAKPSDHKNENGFFNEVITDKLTIQTKLQKEKKPTENEMELLGSSPKIIYKSGTQLSEELKLNKKDFDILMMKQGYLDEKKQITKLGEMVGLKLTTYNERTFVQFPKELALLVCQNSSKPIGY